MRARVAGIYFWVISLAACADPASLRVDIQIREQNLAELDVRVVRDPQRADPPEVLNCSFPAGKKALPGCALEDGAGQWDGTIDRPLSFVLYGHPKTELEITVEGRRAANPTAPAVTSTSAIATLPDKPGQMDKLELELIARTREVRRCPAIEIAPDVGDASNDKSAVTLGVARNRIIATSAGRIVLVDYARSGNECSLAMVTTVDMSMSGACRLRENSLVQGALEVADADGPHLLAGECTNGTAGEVRMIAAVINPGVRPVAQMLTLTGAGLTNTNVSRPVIADLDGDGVRDVIFLINRNNGLSLARWSVQVLPAQAQELALPGLSPYTRLVTNGPLIVESKALRPKSAAIIAGYPGGLGVVSGNPLTFAKLHDDPRTPAMSAAASIIETSDTVTMTVATLYSDTGMEFLTLSGNTSGFTVTDNFKYSIPAGVRMAVDQDVRVAIGDVDGSGHPTAVIVHGGTAALFPMQHGARTSTQAVWRTGQIGGVQSVMLANVDGLPGAEIIAFDPASPLIQGVDHHGTPLDGWPIEAIQGGGLRMLVADLDLASGTSRRDLELVTVSQRNLEVIQLGPQSFDAQVFPWPMIFRDARATGVHGPGDRDPRVVSSNANP